MNETYRYSNECRKRINGETDGYAVLEFIVSDFNIDTVCWMPKCYATDNVCLLRK